MMPSYSEKGSSEMFDFFTCIISLFLLSFLGLIIFVGIKFLYNLATFGKSNNCYDEESQEQLIEDSNGDALMTLADSEILFPEELDDY
jgi:hypothetical protein